MQLPNPASIRVGRLSIQGNYIRGDEVYSDPYSFLYEDNRFNWNAFEMDGITVHWQTQYEDLGQALYNIAARGLASAGQNFIDLIDPQPVNIYAYTNATRICNPFKVIPIQRGLVALPLPRMGLSWSLRNQTPILHQD